MKTVICLLALTSTLLSNPADADHPMIGAEDLAANRIFLEESAVVAEPVIPPENKNNIEIHDEREERILPASSIAESSNYDYKSKKFIYGTLAVVPGGGFSSRNRHGLKGTALDWKVGFFPFIFDTVSYIPVLSVDYNRLHYFKERGTSPYLSYGIGAAYVVPYVPLRAGFEFEHGFIDVGAKVLYLPRFSVVPSPEIRAGFEIKF